MAKLDARRVAAALADPGPFRAILLHGEDSGLVRERAETAMRAVLGRATNDPFRLAELSRDEAAKAGVLAGEMASLAMTGGRKVIRLREATDAHAAALKDALASRGEALLLMESGELQTRSKLRAMAEAEPAVAAIACYPERGEELAATLGRMLKEQGVSADPAALTWLAGRLGEDRMQARREMEKLALFVGEGGRVTEEAAQACSGEGAAAGLDEALMAATAGEAARADQALSAAMAEGATSVAVLRGALRHLQRLHAAALAGGDSSVLRPPVFFRHRAAFDRALRTWSPVALEAAMTTLLEVEKRTRTTAFRDAEAALVRAALAGIARQARR